MDKKIIDRINKLIALSQSPNANEAESAAQAAAELMQQYDVSLSQLEAGKLEDTLGEIGTTEGSERTQLFPWEKTLAMIIANHFNCISYRTRINTSRGYYYTYRHAMNFVGHESNRVTANLMYEWLRSAIYKKARHYSKQIAMQNSFAYGCVKALQAKYWNDKETHEANDNSLMVVDQVQQWMDSHMNLKSGKSRAVSTYSGAVASGMQAGKDLSLNRQFAQQYITA